MISCDFGQRGSRIAQGIGEGCGTFDQRRQTRYSVPRELSGCLMECDDEILCLPAQDHTQAGCRHRTASPGHSSQDDSRVGRRNVTTSPGRSTQDDTREGFTSHRGGWQMAPLGTMRSPSLPEPGVDLSPYALHAVVGQVGRTSPLGRCAMHSARGWRDATGGYFDW